MAGRVPPLSVPAEADLRARVRLAIDYGDAEELATKVDRAIKALEAGQPAMWRALRNQGVFLGRAAPAPVAFLYTGQGSQYLNMLRTLQETEPIVADTFAEADRLMTPILGRPLSDYLFVDSADPSATAAAEEQLRQTEITQPAVLTVDQAITRLLGAYAIQPDMVIGHSLGEYGALVAVGAMSFAGALEAVSARGREMAHVAVADNGLMAAVFAPLEEIQEVLAHVDGYVVIANINSTKQAVIGGASAAVRVAVERLMAAGHEAMVLPVSHAFHTEIVAPAAEPLMSMLRRLRLESPALPLVANVDGNFYPMGPNVLDQMIDILGRQIASPVQFVKGLRTLYDAGCRVFVEVGPKRALHGFVEEVLGDDPEVLALFTNHPKQGDIVAFNQALCGLYSAGLGFGSTPNDDRRQPVTDLSTAEVASPPVGGVTPSVVTMASSDVRQYEALGRLFAEFLAKGNEILGRVPVEAPVDEPVVVTGAGLGLPGGERVFGDDKVPAILRGEQFIESIPVKQRQKIVDKHITRLVKTTEGGGRFESIESVADVIKLAGRAGVVDLVDEFGFPAERADSLDVTSRLAIGAGLDALRDVGIPLVMHYKTATTGRKLPERWMLPEAYRDTTGVIFASAFPGLDALVGELESYHDDRARQQRLDDLRDIRAHFSRLGEGQPILEELDHRMHALQVELQEHPYEFDRKFLFHALSMGHSQFAEYIGARGPNTQVNSACASTTQAVALAEDWIRAGRCERVVIVSGDDVTSDRLLEWFGSGFLASGAAATDDVVADAAVPFDRRRHGMILGMGAAAIVVETAASAARRSIRPIVRVLSTKTANSAFHGSRLDPVHICGVMEDLVATAERRWGIDRREIAPQTVFISHETYTPARGGSAQAEVDALRHVFGESAGQVVISNTKGFTGHAMGVGVEDVVAVKALETGIVPPVPNYKVADPDLGELNLSQGGTYPIRYALRLGAGFGSQISMTLYEVVPPPGGHHPEPDQLGFEHRIVDDDAWRSWLVASCGLDSATTEIAKRTLRIRDDGPPAEMPAASPAPAAMVEAPSSTAAPAEPRVTVVEPQPMPPKPGVAERVPVETIAVEAVPAVVDSALAVAPVGGDAVEQQVMAIVAEQTGYPVDMLEPDLDLEADLGIDTVKQAETFAAIRAAYDIERDDSLALRDYPTLRHVIAFVYERSPGFATAATTATAAVVEAVPAVVDSALAVAPVGGDAVEQQVMAIVAEQTGYPVDMLEPDLDLEADLGIDTVKQAETFAAIRAAYDIERDDSLALRDYPTLRHVIAFVYERSPGFATAATTATAAVVEAVPAVVDSALAVAPVGGDAVEQQVMAIVAEQTGYPVDMLEPDLDLEADLGIDTVKQAETFAAIRAAYDIERDDSLALRDYPTLRHVIAFVYERSPGFAVAAPSPTSAPASQPPARSTVVGELLEGDDDAAEAIVRRVPTAVLRPPLDLCRPTTVTLGQGSRVVVVSDDGGVGAALTDRLQTMGVEVLAIDGAPAAADLESRLDAFALSGPIEGVYWLPALDVDTPLLELDLAGWREALRRRVKLLFAAMRHIGGSRDGEETFLVSATRLGGRHGYEAAGAAAPMGGAVTGFTKAFHREHAGALVKAIDFSTNANPSAVAALLVAETLSDPGAVEVGHHEGRRWTIALDDVRLDSELAGVELTSDTIFAITGAAGSIVTAITADLARASRGTFHLLDLVPEPDAADPDIAAFTADKEALKRTIFDRMKAAGERATPAVVEKEMARIERAHAALSAIAAITSVGGQAYYHSVDLRDGEAVSTAVERIFATSGRIDVLLHAGGLEVSRRIEDKTPAEYDLVFDVKADGWFNLLRAIGDRPLRAAVVFSSVAGRFGNAGQTDYSAANDLLCKEIAWINATRPNTLGIAIDWTAWADIGMASRGSIPTVMKAAGIDMLPARAGIPIVRRELTLRRRGGEVVIGQRLGALVEENDPTGGLDTGGTALTQAAGDRSGLFSDVVGWPVDRGLTVVASLDPAEQPFLHDHQIEGTPVLPGVMGVEAFAEAALLLQPEMRLAAIEDVAFLAPFKFYRHEPRQLTVTCQFTTDGDDLLARCALLGRRQLPNRDEPEETVHFTGTVRLVKTPIALDSVTLPAIVEPTVTAEDIYRIYFHGPAYQVLDEAWKSDGGMVGRLAAKLPPSHHPEDISMVTVPRLARVGVPDRWCHGDRHEGSSGSADEDRPGQVRGQRHRRNRADRRIGPRGGRGVVREGGRCWRPMPRRSLGLQDDRTATPTRRRARAAIAAGRWFGELEPAMDLSRIAIVNRGEPAVRAIHAIRELSFELGIDLRSIALCTDADHQAMFVREADESYALGAATFVDAHDGEIKSSYLDFDRLEDALVRTKADAAWVGWGFVAEQAEFAELCVRLGVKWIGPSPDAMRRAGDKIVAKRIAEAAGITVTPWSNGPVTTLAAAQSEAARLGYPILVKAAGGGGGRGIRWVEHEAELEGALRSARAEALKAFGDDTLFLEKVMPTARHIEVQIIADHYGTVWPVGVRDCSVQRRIRS